MFVFHSWEIFLLDIEFCICCCCFVCLFCFDKLKILFNVFVLQSFWWKFYGIFNHSPFFVCMFSVLKIYFLIFHLPPVWLWCTWQVGSGGFFFLYSFCLEFAELLESATHQIFELFNHYFLDFFLSTSVSFSFGTKTSHILDILIYYRSSCVCLFLFLTYFLSFLLIE